MPSALEEKQKPQAPAAASPEIGRNCRAGFLDMLRGFAIIYVMLYHLLYDLIYFGGVSLPFFFTDIWEMVHKFFLVILFGVSGVCAGFSRNVLKRGAALFLLGELLTMGTALFMPDNLIVFGVLSCFGMIMLIYGVISPFLKKIPNIIIFAVFLTLSVIFSDFYRSDSLFFIFGRIKLDVPNDIGWLYPIGITSSDFRSSDYFPLAPYGFIFLAGTAFSDCVKNRELPDFFYRASLPAVNFCGRYSLWFYIIHQPIFLAATYLLF